MPQVENNERERLSELSRRLEADDATVLRDILGHLANSAGRALKWKFQGTVTEADVEDALSIALFRLWQTRKSFDPNRSSLATWFYLLARNATVDLLRDKSRIERPMSDELEWFSGSFEQQIPSDVRISGLRRALAEALARLTESDRRLLLSELPTADLAAEFGITTTLVRVRKLRLRQKLRRMLEQITSEEEVRQ